MKTQAARLTVPPVSSKPIEVEDEDEEDEESYEDEDYNDEADIEGLEISLDGGSSRKGSSANTSKKSHQAGFDIKVASNIESSNVVIKSGESSK